MKVQVCSDLHLEFFQNREWIKNNPLVAKGDILIIAGDTYHLDLDLSKLDFIKKISDEFRLTYVIPGNHEYYGGYDVSTACETTCEKVKDNVLVVNNYSVLHDNIKFIFSTMWSQIDHNVIEIMQGMADFKMIKYAGQKFTINHYNEIHKKAFEYLSEQISGHENKVVITHHLPSSECNIAEFKNSVLNEAFCVNKTQYILDEDIQYWIYGHSHRNLKDFEIGGTKMITNQLGYVPLNEHYTFDHEKVFEIL